jgi:mannitol 2-dehydrogenase
MPKFILPTVHEQLKSNKAISHAAFVIAWAIYSLGFNEKRKLSISKMLCKKHFCASQISTTNQNYFRIGSCFWKFKSFGYFSDAFAKAYQNIVSFGVEKCIVEMNNNTLNQK